MIESSDRRRTIELLLPFSSVPDLGGCPPERGITISISGKDLVRFAAVQVRNSLAPAITFPHGRPESDRKITPKVHLPLLTLFGLPAQHNSVQHLSRSYSGRNSRTGIFASSKSGDPNSGRAHVQIHRFPSPLRIAKTKR